MPRCRCVDIRWAMCTKYVALRAFSIVKRLAPTPSRPSAIVTSSRLGDDGLSENRDEPTLNRDEHEVVSSCGQGQVATGSGRIVTRPRANWHAVPTKLDAMLRDRNVTNDVVHRGSARRCRASAKVHRDASKPRRASGKTQRAQVELDLRLSEIPTWPAQTADVERTKVGCGQNKISM